MSIHKLNAEHAASAPALALGLNFHHEVYGFVNSVLMTRAFRSLEDNLCRYPIYRLVRCAVVRKRVEVFDNLALQSGLAVMRFDEGDLTLDGPGVFVQARGWNKSEYCSCTVSIWAESIARADAVRDRILEIVGPTFDRGRMFTIDWYFKNGSDLSSASFDEMPDKSIDDAAYPYLGAPVDTFIERYLDAPETVLVLQGPPGVGKTRLVRAILARMSERKGEAAKVMYTADKATLENDEIFVNFITGSHDAFVIEDADHLLKSRSSGNQDLHRFLAIADGVARAQGRKIIFTTNVPNINDIDDALLRPGRCYASVRARMLTREEALRFVATIEGACVASTVDELFANGSRAVSIASIFQAMHKIAG